jgi:hypothetical protein
MTVAVTAAIFNTEISIGFDKIAEVEAALSELGIKVLEMPRGALFLTGKVFLQYKRNKGTKNYCCLIFYY